MVTKPKPKTTPRRTSYKVANHTMAPIVFPRAGDAGLRNPPLILPPGQSIEVDAEEWVNHRRNKMVGLYMDAGLISETKKEGAVAVTAETTTTPNIPAHLLRDDEVVAGRDLGGAQPKATIRRKQPNTIAV